MRKPGILIVLLVISGCVVTNPYEDAAVGIPPVNSGEVLSVELEGEDLICVTEKSNPEERMCVPRLRELPEDS